MNTRTMGRLMMGIGAVGWLLAIAVALAGRQLRGDAEVLSSHLMYALAPTLIMVLVQSWLVVFAWFSRRALLRFSVTSGVAITAPARAIVVACLVVLALTVANFVFGFLTVTGAASIRLHLALATTWWLASGVALVISYRALGTLESAGDFIALSTATAIPRGKTVSSRDISS